MTVRVATFADIPQMHAVRSSVKENALPNYDIITPQMYEDHIGNRGKGWVYEVDHRVAGFAVVDMVDKSVWALFVHPDAEGQGIGRALHDTMLGWVRGQGENLITLTTEPDSRAFRFYEKAGWVQTGLTDYGDMGFEKTLRQ